MSRSYNTILCIDGGGVRGIIPAIVLQYIEAQTGKKICDLFDLIVGTSTGGLLATGLSCPAIGKICGPYPASDLVKFYEKRSKQIFDRIDFGFISDLFDDEKYDEKPLEDILVKLLGNAELKDTEPHIVVTAYDIEQRRPYFFKTRKALRKRARNHLLRDVARAATAAPTYFEPVLLKKKRWRDNAKRRVLIDGGVFACNPAMVGFSEAKYSNTQEEDMVICSIGTGINDRSYRYSDAKSWGLVGWGKRLPYIVMDGMSDSTDYHLRRLLPDDKTGPLQRYFRFDIHLKRGMDDIDNATRTNLHALRGMAEEIISSRQIELKRLCSLLKDRLSSP